jgi:3'-5' exoribonuclease
MRIPGSCVSTSPGGVRRCNYLCRQMSSASARNVEQMEQDLRELIATVQSPHLNLLLERMLGRGTDTWTEFRDAPAAKRYHHAYRHGLLDHSVTVAQAVSALSGIFGGVNRDVALTGALLHDIGKLDAYRRVGEEIEMSDAGRLHGEIALGYARVRDEIARIDEFPFELCQALLHIILSHHGSLEHGSPVVPCTREAMLVHMADNLGSKLGSFDRVERELDAGARWAGYDNGVGAVAYFGATGAEPQSARLAA